MVRVKFHSKNVYDKLGVKSKKKLIKKYTDIDSLLSR